MMAHHTIRFLFAVLLVAPFTTHSQNVLPRSNGFLIVETNAEDALILVGSEVLGVAADSPFHLPSGPKRIAIVEASASGWAPRRTEGEAFIRAGETTTVRLDLPIRYRIDSLPPGATVSLESDSATEVLGETPLVVDRPEHMEGVLVVRRPGFALTELSPGDSLFNRHMALMRPLEAGSEQDAAATWIPPREPRRWIDYAAAGVALAAASVAVYYKFEADAVDDRYRSPESSELGDPRLKSEAERLDLYSLGALGVMQAGITLLAVRLILR